MKFKNTVLSITMMSICMPMLSMHNSMVPKFDTPDLRALENPTSDLEDVTQKIKQEMDLCDPTPEIRSIAEEALKTCGVTEPVIILQDQNVSDSVVHRLTSDNRLIIAVGVKGGVPLPFIKWSIYHECAHIVYGDVNSSNTFLNLGRRALEIGAAYYVASQCNAVMQKMVSKFPRYLANALVFVAASEVAGRAYHKIVVNYDARVRERRADIFAAQTLIHKKHDITSCVVTFVNFKLENTFALFNDHPSDKERAEIILKEFKKANVDFENLPLDSEVLEKAGSSKELIQKFFTKTVRAHFPGYLDSQKI